MDVILKDGTRITNATPHDVIELAKNGIINADNIKRSYFDEPKDEADEFFNSLGSNEMLDACRDLCKDNDLIPPEYHDGEPEIDGNSPGFGSIQNLIAKGQVIDCPNVDFPRVNFEKQPNDWAATGMSASFPATACCNISANNSVIRAEDIEEKDGGFAVIGHAILPVGNW